MCYEVKWQGTRSTEEAARGEMETLGEGRVVVRYCKKPIPGFADYAVYAIER